VARYRLEFNILTERTCRKRTGVRAHLQIL
jgi:hypothetical protein